MVLVQKRPFFQDFFLGAIQARKMSFTIFQNEETSLQAIKTRSLKRREIDIFPKGLTHGFGPKIAIFPIFFQALYASKMSFTIFQNEKTPFQAIKARSLKSRKIKFFFQRGLRMVFVVKRPFFQLFFFRHYRPGKCLLRYSKTKKHLSRL